MVLLKELRSITEAAKLKKYSYPVTVRFGEHDDSKDTIRCQNEDEMFKWITDTVLPILKDWFEYHQDSDTDYLAQISKLVGTTIHDDAHITKDMVEAVVKAFGVANDTMEFGDNYLLTVKSTKPAKDLTKLKPRDIAKAFDAAGEEMFSLTDPVNDNDTGYTMQKATFLKMDGDAAIYKIEYTDYDDEEQVEEWSFIVDNGVIKLKR